MNALPGNNDSSTRRVIAHHVLALVVAAACSLAASLLIYREHPTLLGLTILAAVGVVALASAWQLRRTLRQSEIVERLLAGLADGMPEPQTLPQLIGPTRVAAGWNRVAEHARKWFALEELRQSLANAPRDAQPSATYGLLDSLPDGVAATDESGVVLFANPTFLSVFQAGDSTGVVNEPLLQSPTIDDQTRQELAQTPARSRAAVEFATPSGRRVRLTRTPRLGEGGSLTGHVWVARDVSQQRLAEEMRDKFLATATHELRTPLANLCAYAESLATMDDLDVESQKQFYNIIQSEAKRLAQLVDDLLDVSRMQAGALAIDRTEVDLGRMIEEVAHKVSASMRAKSIDFVQELPPKYPKILADKSKLAASLVNLLGNAVKYTPEGGRVTFRVDMTDERVEFGVADTGIGIAPEELPKVFERFFRSDDQRVRDIPGSGLGLSLTQEVARLHGGDLTVDSELNVGSIFKLTLPLPEDHDSP